MNHSIILSNMIRPPAPTKKIIRIKTGRRLKTTNEQFTRMAKFMSGMVLLFRFCNTIGLFCSVEHKQENLDKSTFYVLWNDLTIELNDIGPPVHSTAEWKRIWSVHKYRNKRKRIAESDRVATRNIDQSGIDAIVSLMPLGIKPLYCY